MATDGFTPSFTPKLADPLYFQQDAYIVGPNGWHGKIEPDYCATTYTASILAEILADLKPAVVLGPPFGAWPTSGGFLQTVQATYLQFPNGCQINAGQLAGKFLNQPAGPAEFWMRADVAVTLAAWDAEKNGGN